MSLTLSDGSRIVRQDGGVVLITPIGEKWRELRADDIAEELAEPDLNRRRPILMVALWGDQGSPPEVIQIVRNHGEGCVDYRLWGEEGHCRHTPVDQMVTEGNLPELTTGRFYCFIDPVDLPTGVPVQLA